MKIDPKKKLNLKKVLDSISSPEEKEELNRLDVKEIVALHEEELERRETEYTKLLDSFNEYSKVTRQQSVALAEGFTTFTEALAKKLEDMGSKISTSYENNKAPDLSGFFKDMPAILTDISGYSKKTSELITNLKWNTSVAVRNKNGSPINPSIDSFGVGDFDEVRPSSYDGNNNPGIVTYYLSGNQVAVITLTYSGANLTSAKKTA